MDEATSAIDVRGERIVQEALDRVSKNRTTITIAHRLSTIKKADNIIVLRDGTAMEEGTHQELLANPDGVYYRLVHAQNLEALAEEDEGESDATMETAEQVLSRKQTELGNVAGGRDEDEPPYQNKGVFRTVWTFISEQPELWFWYMLALVATMGCGGESLRFLPDACHSYPWPQPNLPN